MLALEDIAIRCNAHQVNMTTTLTCVARLKWLDTYEQLKRNSPGDFRGSFAYTRAESYKLCRQCPTGKYTGPVKPAKKPSVGVAQAIVTCTLCKEVVLTYARGICKRCYMREYIKRRSGK